MPTIAIRPQWSLTNPAGEPLPPRLIDLLVLVAETGSLAAACQRAGLSYRHAWDTLRAGESWFGSPLLLMERGRGSRLTVLGDKLVWADRRIAARLAPVLDTLACELEVELQRVLAPARQRLRVHASHGWAIERLINTLVADGIDVERVYTSSQEAAASLQAGTSDLACFHVPCGHFEARGWEVYARWLDPQTHVLIDIAARSQGLMLRRGNPLAIGGVADLVRPGVRFINRQRGSGTRFLLDCLLAEAQVSPEHIQGFEHAEYTHAAIAAFIGSGMADVGLGLAEPARQFDLDFIPLATERYFAICRQDALERPEIAHALALLRSDDFRAQVALLRGYDPLHCGEIHPLREVLAPLGLLAPAH